MARFKISKVFTLINLGQVLEGEVMDGEIAPGDLIRILINESALSIKIKSIEYLERRGKKTKLGLTVGPFEQSVREKLEIIVGRTVSII